MNTWKCKLCLFVLTFFFLFVVLPVIYMFLSSIFLDNSFIQNIKSFDKNILFLLFKSVRIAFSVAVLSTLFGSVFGFFIYKTSVPLRNLFKIILLVPLFVSPYIMAVAWKSFFYIFFNGTNHITNSTGVVFVLTTIYTPLSILITGNAFANINSHIEESGLITTSFNNVIFKILLPLIKPALYSSFVLVFIFSISEFSVPAFLNVNVFTTEIFTQFSAFYNHALSVLQSFLLVVVCISLLLTEAGYIFDAPFISIGNKGSMIIPFNFNYLNFTGFILLLLWFTITVIIPVLTLTLQAFNNGTEIFYNAYKLLSPTFLTSFGLAIAGTFMITLTGLAAAYLTYNNKQGIFIWMLLVVFAIPSIIFGISLIKFYNRPFLNFIYSGFGLIIIGYTGKFSFISYKLIDNSLKQIPQSLTESAIISGVSASSLFKNIILPLIVPAITASLVIGFVLSIGELSTTIMLYPPGSEIVPIKVFTIMANASQALTSSMTLIVFSITLLMLFVFYFLLSVTLKKYNLPND